MEKLYYIYPSYRQTIFGMFDYILSNILNSKMAAIKNSIIAIIDSVDKIFQIILEFSITILLKIQPSKGYENFNESYPMILTLEAESFDTRAHLNESKAIIPITKGNATKGFEYDVKIKPAETNFGTMESDDGSKPLKFNFMVTWQFECKSDSNLNCK